MRMPACSPKAEQAQQHNDQPSRKQLQEAVRSSLNHACNENRHRGTGVMQAMLDKGRTLLLLTLRYVMAHFWCYTSTARLSNMSTCGETEFHCAYEGESMVDAYAGDDATPWTRPRGEEGSGSGCAGHTKVLLSTGFCRSRWNTPLTFNPKYVKLSKPCLDSATKITTCTGHR